MTSEEQLEILRQGVDTWNQWRKENSDMKIDLSCAILIDANLIGVNLSDADLSDAILTDADLKSINFRNANLISADLSGADLQGAIFKGTKYNEDTEWPEGFDPKKNKGLTLCD